MEPQEVTFMPTLHQMGRRQVLKAGAVFGLGLSNILRATSRIKTDDEFPARATSVIHVHLPGGLAHQDSFDPKPYSPLAYRGQTRAIDTKLPGVQFSHHMDRMAKVADKLTIIRSFSHNEADHARGTHNMLTGYRPSPAVVFPSMGSVTAHELGPRHDLPPYVCVPGVSSTFSGSGYLSSSFAPFGLGADPADDKFKVRDLNAPSGVDVDRFERRKELLKKVNSGFGGEQAADELIAMDSFYERAYDLLQSQAAKDAFRIELEDDKLRDRYGRNAAGQRMLLARRLVEAGVRYVTVTVDGWDDHRGIHNSLKTKLPRIDKAFARLVRDLDERGMLDETLVLLTTEFGRTPKINADGGRDHWPGVFSVVLAGGGVKRGYVHGRSDATASAPEVKRVSPADFARTLFMLTGIQPDKELMAPGDRPLSIQEGGRLIRDILA